PLERPGIFRPLDADATPVYFGGLLYAASYSGGLYALEPSNGSVRWLRKEYTGVVGIAAAPGERLILASSEGGLVCVRAKDGEMVWKVQVKRGSPGIPLVLGDKVLYTESRGGLVLRSLAFGKEVDRIEFGHGWGGVPVTHGHYGAALSNSGVLFFFEIGKGEGRRASLNSSFP
ncbi:MAG: PQQ-binding-like beta-propeller repeat protein, partial [Sandaracinaceae bacterium]|nr:PQQ-binding-like beta-propeller repeat protein [Sandaracinaceae bacterium]